MPDDRPMSFADEKAAGLAEYRSSQMLAITGSPNERDKARDALYVEHPDRAGLMHIGRSPGDRAYVTAQKRTRSEADAPYTAPKSYAVGAHHTVIRSVNEMTKKVTDTSREAHNPTMPAVKPRDAVYTPMTLDSSKKLKSINVPSADKVSANKLQISKPSARAMRPMASGPIAIPGKFADSGSIQMPAEGISGIPRAWAAGRRPRGVSAREAVVKGTVPVPPPPSKEDREPPELPPYVPGNGMLTAEQQAQSKPQIASVAEQEQQQITRDKTGLGSIGRTVVGVAQAAAKSAGVSAIDQEQQQITRDKVGPPKEAEPRDPFSYGAGSKAAAEEATKAPVSMTRGTGMTPTADSSPAGLSSVQRIAPVASSPATLTPAAAVGGGAVQGGDPAAGGRSVLEKEKTNLTGTAELVMNGMVVGEMRMNLARRA